MVLNFSGLDRRTVLGRALRWPLGLIPRDARLPILQGPLRGRRWIAGSSTHGCWLGSYERAQQRILAQRIKPGDVVFDVGAHVGFHTLLASVLVGDTGRVMAFEPVPANLRYLREHLRLNAVGNVEVIEAAVSDRAGCLRLAPGPASSMWHREADGALEVEAVCLDELVRSGRLPPPRVLKMDIEGGEIMALRGAADVLRRCRPVLLLSTHGAIAHRECCELLLATGYRLEPVGGASLAECRELLAVAHGP